MEQNPQLNLSNVTHAADDMPEMLDCMQKRLESMQERFDSSYLRAKWEVLFQEKACMKGFPQSHTMDPIGWLASQLAGGIRARRSRSML